MGVLVKRFAFAAAVLFSLASFAQDSAEHRHLGPLVHMDAAVGFFATSADGYTISGAAGELDVSVGGALTENLILGGELWLASASNPTLSGRGVSVATEDATVSAACIGPQLTYYFMPVNLYLSGAIGLSRLYDSVGGNSSSTNVGGAVLLAVGKEWWISHHWGIGIAGRAMLSTNSDPDPRVNGSWSTFAGSVSLSATYN
jgi:hypothetical protein